RHHNKCRSKKHEVLFALSCRMCSYPHLQYHFDQYELDCRHRDTPREVHEQRFAGSSFAHHLLQSNTNSQALPLVREQSRALPLLPGTAQRYRLGAPFSPASVLPHCCRSARASSPLLSQGPLVRRARVSVVCSPIRILTVTPQVGTIRTYRVA